MTHERRDNRIPPDRNRDSRLRRSVRSESAARTPSRAAHSERASETGSSAARLSRGERSASSRRTAPARRPTSPRPAARTSRTSAKPQARKHPASERPQPRTTNRAHQAARAPQPKRRRVPFAAVGVAATAILVAVAGAFAFAQSLPVAITFNGQPLEVGGARTLADALDASGFDPRPGDLVAVDGSVIEAGKGEPFHAAVNGQVTSDLTRTLANGDVVEMGDGSPTEEPSDIVEEAIPYTISSEGGGAIHLLEGQGADGLRQIKTGQISGIVAEITAREPQNVTRRNVSPDVGDEKVVALTFDDGPWHDTTVEVLDVLRDHGAKATFFTVGSRIEGEGIDLVKRAASEGHQICTHTYTHASGSGKGVNLGFMAPDEQTAEIEQGFAAIENAIGGEASHIIRTPGGNYGDEVMRAIGPKVSAEIGWDIDSQDWRRPGSAAIANQIKSAWPGAIVLMHDGGGDRSQTVEALKDALPYLKEQGYRFVTIDELMSYPLA